MSEQPRTTITHRSEQSAHEYAAERAEREGGAFVVYREAGGESWSVRPVALAAPPGAERVAVWSGGAAQGATKRPGGRLGLISDERYRELLQDFPCPSGLVPHDRRRVARRRLPPFAGLPEPAASEVARLQAALRPGCGWCRVLRGHLWALAESGIYWCDVLPRARRHLRNGAGCEFAERLNERG